MSQPSGTSTSDQSSRTSVRLANRDPQPTQLAPWKSRRLPPHGSRTDQADIVEKALQSQIETGLPRALVQTTLLDLALQKHDWAEVSRKLKSICNWLAKNNIHAFDGSEGREIHFTNIIETTCRASLRLLGSDIPDRWRLDLTSSRRFLKPILESYFLLRKSYLPSPAEKTSSELPATKDLALSIFAELLRAPGCSASAAPFLKRHGRSEIAFLLTKLSHHEEGHPHEGLKFHSPALSDIFEEWIKSETKRDKSEGESRPALEVFWCTRATHIQNFNKELRAFNFSAAFHAISNVTDDPSLQGEMLARYVNFCLCIARGDGMEMQGESPEEQAKSSRSIAETMRSAKEALELLFECAGGEQSQLTEILQGSGQLEKRSLDWLMAIQSGGASHLTLAGNWAESQSLDELEGELNRQMDFAANRYVAFGKYLHPHSGLHAFIAESDFLFPMEFLPGFQQFPSSLCQLGFLQKGLVSLLIKSQGSLDAELMAQTQDQLVQFLRTAEVAIGELSAGNREKRSYARTEPGFPQREDGQDHALRETLSDFFRLIRTSWIASNLDQLDAFIRQASSIHPARNAANAVRSRIFTSSEAEFFFWLCSLAESENTALSPSSQESKLKNQRPAEWIRFATLRIDHKLHLLINHPDSTALKTLIVKDAQEIFQYFQKTFFSICQDEAVKGERPANPPHPSSAIQDLLSSVLDFTSLFSEKPEYERLVQTGIEEIAQSLKTIMDPLPRTVLWSNVIRRLYTP